MELKSKTTSSKSSVLYGINVENFTWIQKPLYLTSPIVMSVGHNGFQKDNFLGLIPLRKNGVNGADLYVWPLVKGITWAFPIQLVRGLIPRHFVDYNRYISRDAFRGYAGDLFEETEEACEDSSCMPFHTFYHDSIIDLVHKTKSEWGPQSLFIDFHGYSHQPVYGDYDVILGTANRKTVNGDEDFKIAELLRERGYDVFLPIETTVISGVEDVFDAGFTTRNVFLKTDVTSIQIEVHASIRKDKQKAIKFSREFREILFSIYPSLIK